MLADKYPRICMNPCVSHEIHSLLKNIYNAVGWVKITFDRVVSVIKDMTRDAHILFLMRKYTSISGELQHANSVSESFASKYPMVCLIVKNKGGLDQLVASTEWKTHFDDQNSEMAKPFAEFIQNGDFWTDAEDLLKVMEPIVRVLRLVEDDRSTSGYLYEAMKSAEEEIAALCSSNNQMNKYQRILELFQDRRKHIVTPMHEVAAFLNPDYMRQRIFTDQNSDQMQKSNAFLLKTVVSEDEKKTLTKQLLLYGEQTSELFTKDACEQLKEYHPVTWWELCGVPFLVLKKHAMRILGQPCKCSLRLMYNAVELVQNMKMKTRNTDTRNKIMNIKMNEMLMERYQRLGEKNLGERNLFPIPDCSKLPDYYVAHDHKGWGDDDDYVDNFKDSDKADGAGQTGLGVEPLAGDHAIVKSDVSSCKDDGEEKNISDTFAQLKDFLPGCHLPDVGKMNSDFQALLHWFQRFLLKVDAEKWGLNPAKASQQKEGANLRLDSDIVEPKQGMIVEDQSKRKANNQNMQGATSSLGPLDLISPTPQGEFGKSTAASMSHPSGESGYTGQAPQLVNTEMGSGVMVPLVQSSISPSNQQQPNQLTAQDLWNGSPVPKGGTPIDSDGHRSEFGDHQGNTRSIDPTSVPEVDSVPSQVLPATSTAGRFLDGIYSSTTEMQSPTGSPTTDWRSYFD